jgi:hypothetical protein
MQGEPVLDRWGVPTGVYRYEGGVANKALELLGKELGMFKDAKPPEQDAAMQKRLEGISEVMQRLEGMSEIERARRVAHFLRKAAQKGINLFPDDSSGGADRFQQWLAGGSVAPAEGHTLS